MRVFESLSRHSWIRIGGDGEVFRPATVEEFLDCYGKGPVVGEGSNVLWHPATRRIVSSKKLQRIARIDCNVIETQCGIPNSRLLKYAAKHGLGGIEYLASIPGTIGGAVFMNAGRGQRHRCSIGQRVVEVEYFDGTHLHKLSRQECGFGYRTSCFHRHPDWMIVSVTLALHSQSPAMTLELMRARRRYAMSVQDRSAPTLGTVFSHGYNHQEALEGIRCGGIEWSRRSKNWMINTGNGTYRDCINLLNEIRKHHTSALELEIRIL